MPVMAKSTLKWVFINNKINMLSPGENQSNAIGGGSVDDGGIATLAATAGGSVMRTGRFKVSTRELLASMSSCFYLRVVALESLVLYAKLSYPALRLQYSWQCGDPNRMLLYWESRPRTARSSI